MIAFLIPKGTEVQKIQDGKEWCSKNMNDIVTDEDLLFFAEDVIVDPLGHLGCGPQNANTIGGHYAKQGWYGFRRDGFAILVPMREVVTG